MNTIILLRKIRAGTSPAPTLLVLTSNTLTQFFRGTYETLSSWLRPTATAFDGAACGNSADQREQTKACFALPEPRFARRQTCGRSDFAYDSGRESLADDERGGSRQAPGDTGI